MSRRLIRQRDSQVRPKTLGLLQRLAIEVGSASSAVAGCWRCFLSHALSWLSRMNSFSNRRLMFTSPKVKLTAMSTASSRGATPDTIRRSEVKLGEREVVAVMVMCLGNGLRLQSA